MVETEDQARCQRNHHDGTPCSKMPPGWHQCEVHTYHMPDGRCTCHDVPEDKKCKTCKGDGWVGALGPSKCTACGGTGMISDEPKYHDEIERVALAPRSGDVVILRGGQIRYIVSAVDNSDTYLVGGNRPSVLVTREETFREAPYTREGTHREIITRSAWADFVKHAACTVGK